jgi:RNA polymerase sigma-70 factor, ECF subfamily
MGQATPHLHHHPLRHGIPPATAHDSAMGLDRDDAVRAMLADEVRLLGYIRAIVGQQTLAEDIFQDLVLLVMHKHEQIPNAEALPGWARRASRFLALKALDKRKREQVSMSEPLIALLEAQAAESDGQVDNSEYLEALRSCRETLSPNAQQMLDLRYNQGISGQDIAERLERPLNTVYVAITRLHRSLATCIEKRLGKGT